MNLYKEKRKTILGHKLDFFLLKELLTRSENYANDKKRRSFFCVQSVVKGNKMPKKTHLHHLKKKASLIGIQIQTIISFIEIPLYTFQVLSFSQLSIA